MSLPTTTTTMPIVLQYHEIRGLASPIRMMLEYAGIPYTNKYAENWRTGTNEKAQVAKVNALANLPALFEEDGSIVTQSCAVNFHVGEKAGLNGSTPAERSRVDQVRRFFFVFFVFFCFLFFL